MVMLENKGKMYKKLHRNICVWLETFYLHKGFSGMRDLMWVLDRMRAKVNSPSARIIVKTIEWKLK